MEIERNGWKLHEQTPLNKLVATVAGSGQLLNTHANYILKDGLPQSKKWFERLENILWLLQSESIYVEFGKPNVKNGRI